MREPRVRFSEPLDAGLLAPDELGALGDALLVRARNEIARRLGAPTAAEPDHPALVRSGATFVTLTLKRDAALRGCVGTLEPYAPLEVDVRDNALGAAFRDLRFVPLSAAEFGDIRVEVSLLGAAQPVRARDESEAIAALRPHTDGAILRWRGRRATFLPQVWEGLADPGQFLLQLKRKAGIPDAVWDDDIELSRYQVLKWKEPLRQLPGEVIDERL